MLKTLIWKQFYECFRGYFIDSKTGKAKKKNKIIFTFVMFIVLMLFLGFCFYMMAVGFEAILDTEFKWLYYAVFGILTISLGTFASVFNTANSLYNAKDNNLLLSLPIKPIYVLLSRISLVYGLSFLYSAFVWVPICIFPFIKLGFNLLTCILDILLLFIITLLTSVISCAVGYVIAYVNTKIKNKSIISVALSIIFLVAYYAVCFRFSDFLNTILANSETIANGISTWANLIYQLAKAADGNILSFVIFTVICIALASICYVILNRSFMSIVTKSTDNKITKTKVTYKANNKISNTLFKKELKKFTSLPIYMMNCGLGILFVLAIAIIFAIRRNTLLPLIEAFTSEIPMIANFIPLVIIGIVCMVMSMNAAAVPSISLEGKNLWILKSLPINTIDILMAKEKLQSTINVVPAVIASIIMCVTVKMDFNTSVYIVAVVVVFLTIHATTGVLLALVNPNFTWTSEVQPIKQDINVLLEMIISVVLIGVLLGSYYFFRNTMDAQGYLEILIIVMVIIELLLRKLLRTWGVNKFDSL